MTAIVTKYRTSDRVKRLVMEEAGLNGNVRWLPLFSEYRPEEPSKDELKEQGERIRRIVSKERWILAMGNEALFGVTGHSGIQKWRGRLLPTPTGGEVIATLAPAAVDRSPGFQAGWLADLRFFGVHTRGDKPALNPPRIFVARDGARVHTMAKAIENAEICSYDVETTTGTRQEFEPDAAIISLAVSTEDHVVWVLPLFHPQSPLTDDWEDALYALHEAFRSDGRWIAHNGKFDARWLRRFDVPARVTFDTMLGAHLLDENMPKGLKPQARIRLGVAPWGIDTKTLLSVPIQKVLRYNALDAHYTRHLYHLQRADLIEQTRLRRIFVVMTMPASETLIEAERRGVWVDRRRLARRHQEARKTLAGIERRLMRWVPSEVPYPVNFNPSTFARWWLFDHLGLPVVKQKKTGPSMDEETLLLLKGKHPAIKLMLERTKWQKYVSAFFSNYEQQLDKNDRVHTSFKQYGTVTGRLSSGKTDQEKIASRAKQRGLNLQQVPRDAFIRGLFGSPRGWTFVEADFSQIELRIVAYLSRDPELLRAYQLGLDVHMMTATDVLGKRPDQIDKEERKKAKAVNFGFVYGMGWRKFIHTAFTKYELTFSEAEAKNVRAAFFRKYHGLPRWHAQQRRLVAKHRRVVSPIGRIRRLPDIQSPDKDVRAEAERQAINSPVQSLGSDMTQLSMVELGKIFEREFRGKAFVVGTVHDSLLFEVKDESLDDVLPVIKEVMENLPLEEKFGCAIDVPIVVDLKTGSHWGDLEEVKL